MSSFEKKLNKHIDKVLALQKSEEEKMLSLEELKEIDMGLGVTEEEWEQMMEKAKKEEKLAQNHFYYKNYKDAYTTAESAVSINPYLTQALVLMADSALKIYETEDDDDFLIKAENHAKEVLKQSPAENRAVEILAILNKHKKTEKTQRSKMIKIGGGVVIVAILILAIIFWPREKKPKKINESVKFELIDAEENANAKWAQVENVISRRDNLIPQLFTLTVSEDENIVQLKKDTEKIKQEIALVDGDKRIELQAELQKKYQELTNSISKNNNDENIATLMVQLEGSYNRIAVEGKRYNDVVKNYNILVKKYGSDFPEFKIKPYFKGQ
ncbi:MAG: LemA family protein [Bacteroidales bacterium]|nr:LemA family protein [Bacteroidales bacterium]